MRTTSRVLEKLIVQSSLRGSSQIQQLVLQEVKLLNEEVTYLEFLHEEGNRLKAEGYSREQVNEQLADMFGGLLSQGMEGAIDTLKAYIIDGLLSVIGLDPKQKSKWGLLGCAISNTIEELEVDEFKRMFSAGSAGFSEEGLKGIWPQICDDLSDVVMRGVTECATQTAQRSNFVLNFYKAIVGDTAVADAQDSFLWKTSDEMLQNFINDTELMTNIRGQISEWLCNLDISEMFGSLAGGLKGIGSSLLKGIGLDKLIPGMAEE